MSSSGSEVIPNTTYPLGSLAKSLFESTSEIIASVESIGTEHENFIVFGSYLYRASIAIMELETAENIPSNAVEILQSLSKTINLVKDLLLQTNLNPETRDTTEKLEQVIKNTGEGLSLIPISTYEEYAQIAIQSIIKEMQNYQFEVRQIQVHEHKEEPESAETDLYSIEVEVSMEMPKFSDISVEFRGHKNERFIEPLYEAFYCPLKGKIMDDPVTIETGVTYEREAIMEWFQKFENGGEIFCPKTGQKLMGIVLSTNMALKATIEEWRDRNEEATIKFARTALSLASTEKMVVEALEDLQSICQTKKKKKAQVRKNGVIALLGKFLEYKDRKVRCATLELLRQLAEDDAGKEEIKETIDIKFVIKMLSSNHQAIRHASLLLLLELSKSQSMCNKIGSVTGGILMLITIKHKQASDAYASENAHAILRNLETCPNNVKYMAEYGHWEPLLNHLIEGSEELKIEMASYLGETVHVPDSRICIAEKASPVLIKMIRSGNTLARNAALKALKQISCNKSSCKPLVEAGTIKIMAEEMFRQKITNEPMDPRREAAEILANILDSDELERILLKISGNTYTLSLDYIIYNIVYRLKSSSSNEVVISFIRILICLMKSHIASTAIVSVIKETEASYSLIELINNPNEEIGVASIKLLTTLSPFIGHTLAERLWKTGGKIESLIERPNEINGIGEKHAVSANFLAKLPHQNLTLNLALLEKNTIPTVLENINEIRRIGTRTSRYESSYLEGLVGTLVRFTKTLYDNQVLFQARDYNFTSVFTELLMETSSDEVRKLSAIGLENLSLQSVNLSKPPETKTKYKKLFLLRKCLFFDSSKLKKMPICPVHRGVCSSQGTFCLIDAKAVQRLLTCLNHENSEVVEAALSAISTLLDDKVDVEKSVSILSEFHATQHVLNVLKEHQEENLWQKSFWLIEKFLMKGGDKSISDISQDRMFPATLISVLNHGNGSTRQQAEKILMCLNKMPNYSTTFTM